MKKKQRDGLLQVKCTKNQLMEKVETIGYLKKENINISFINL